MKFLVRQRLVIGAYAILCVCDAPVASSPAARLSRHDTAATSTHAIHPSALRPEDSPNSATDKEPRMPRRETKVEAASKPPAKPVPARAHPAVPKRNIQPSPFQPPAEIDPAHVSPGDEVPR